MGGSSSSKMVTDLDTSIVQQNVTNILNKQKSRVSNTIQNVQDIKIVIEGEVCGNIILTQKMVAEMDFVDQVNSQTALSIKSQMQNDITNTTGQTFQKISEMLGNIMGRTNTDITAKIATRVEQIVEKNITMDKLNEILKDIVNTQTATITIKKDVGCKEGSSSDIIVDQDMLVKIASKSIIDDVVNLATDDQVINSVVNSANQTAIIQEKGLNDIMSTWAGIFTGPAAIVLIVAGAIVFIVAKNATEKGNFQWLLIIGGLLTLILVYMLVIAPKYNMWPFKEPKQVYYTCQVDPETQEFTGKCEKTETKTPSTFDDEDACVNSGCMKWGCELNETTKIPTGECIRYKNILLGNYDSKEACQKAITDGKDCTGWDCTEKTDDKGVTTKSCTSTPFDKSKFATRAECNPTCGV